MTVNYHLKLWTKLFFLHSGSRAYSFGFPELVDGQVAYPLFCRVVDRWSYWGRAHTRWFVVGIINAVKVNANLYEDVGHVLGSAAIAAMRSHACRTVLNNRAIAQRG